MLKEPQSQLEETAITALPTMQNLSPSLFCTSCTSRDNPDICDTRREASPRQTRWGCYLRRMP